VLRDKKVVGVFVRFQLRPSLQPNKSSH
jgi:hypothetical protein